MLKHSGFARAWMGAVRQCRLYEKDDADDASDPVRGRYVAGFEAE